MVILCNMLDYCKKLHCKKLQLISLDYSEVKRVQQYTKIGRTDISWLPHLQLQLQSNQEEEKIYKKL